MAWSVLSAARHFLSSAPEVNNNRDEDPCDDGPQECTHCCAFPEPREETNAAANDRPNRAGDEKKHCQLKQVHVP